MKISAKTLEAARKAAKARGMTLDSWAEQVLASAAASPGQPPDIKAELRTISKKIDLLAERQGLSERASEQLTDAVQAMGASYKGAQERAGRVLSEAETWASSAAEELTVKARELLERARSLASDFLGPIRSPAEGEGDSAGEPTKRKRARKPNQSRADKGTKSVRATRRRSTSSEKKSEQPRGSQRRRSRSKSNG